MTAFDVRIPINTGVAWSERSKRETKAASYVTVSARYSGVPGLIVTQLHSLEGIVSNRWVLTHRATGRALGSRSFTSISAAQRAARHIAMLPIGEPLSDGTVPILDWTDEAAVWSAVTDDQWTDEASQILADEGTYYRTPIT